MSCRMSVFRFLGVVAAAMAVWVCPSAAAKIEGGYVVVVSKATAEQPEWKKVVDALTAKYDATVVQYDAAVTESLGPLSKRAPRYVCFVARSEEAGRKFVADVHQLTRKLDGDPYTDAIWGILTGYDAANALRIARHAEPLVVRRVASGTDVALEMCHEGVWYCELKKNRMVRKRPGGKPAPEKGPDDTTKALVDTLNEYKAQLFVTSGHATTRDWQIGFRYRNGSFRCEKGRLFGRDTGRKRFDVDSPNPKVYAPIGNCLMGHIDSRDAMALAWMNSAGVMQMIGYTVPTGFGYGGWGQLDYFLEQPGRYTFAEAFYANHQALLHRLETKSPGSATQAMPAPKRGSGSMLGDRDVVAFYGDPAWEARMAPAETAWRQKLTEKDGRFTFTITPKRGEKTFQPISTNGSQRGWRPIFAFLPHRIGKAEVVEGSDLKPLITDNFLLIPNPRTCEAGREYKVVFKTAPAKATPDAKTYMAWVTKLTSPDFEGRGVGTKGIVRAREYIAAHFKSLGLKGAFDGKLTQEFSVRGGVRAVRRELAGGKGKIKAKPGEDFVPFGFSASKAFDAEAVFVGYAVTSSGRKYDSFAAAEKDDLRGKIAIALRYEPHDAKGKSAWTKPAGSWSRDASLAAKAAWAAKHGAAALLIVNPPTHRPGELIATERTARGSAKIPVLHVTGTFLKRILTAAGRDEKAYGKLIDKANTTGGIDPLGVTLAGRVELKPYTSPLHNVAAVLPGAGKLADEYVIVGAHYDHIGFGRSGRKQLHPGADDNASGTSGVMMLAKWFAKPAPELPTPRRTIVFTTFAGEEIGLRGSRHLIAHLSDLGIKREQIATMVNMDMIGRLKDDRLAVWGADSGKGLRGLVGELGGKCGLKLQMGTGIGPSDHAAFYAAKVPVVCLITGVHRDMHRPTDTPDKIDGEGAVKVLRFARTLITALATRPERIAYTPLPPRSRRAYLGVMPDPSAKRCVLARIVPDGPADKAGLHDGDILVKWADKPIADANALRAQLARTKPGRKVRIQVLRGTKEVDLTVKLGGR